jgi:hypothetical protein
MIGMKVEIAYARRLRARTALLAVLATCMFVASSTALVSAAGAEKSILVQGNMTWDLGTLQILDSIAAEGGNTILWGTTTVCVTGDLAAEEATDSWKEILYQTGALRLNDVMSIPTTIDDKSGTITMLLVGRAEAPGSYWTGEWTIMSATEGLAGLRGVGAWWTAEVGYDFSGVIHFT